MLLSSAALGDASSEQVVVFWDITERERAEAAVVRSNERLEGVLRSITTLIGKVVEARDPYTQGHEQGVARIGRQIAEEMGLPADEVEAIEVAALVHDVGKLSVPAEILTKPGTLSDTEFQLIRVHSQGGYEILKDIDFDWPVADIVVQHHERMDGSGYPAGLAGDEISVAARVLMVADVIEAMAAHRPYRPALGLQAAMDEITTHPERFDPQVIAACARLWERGAFAV
jgi:putative nucleotidyltransferase with HDIG domain